MDTMTVTQGFALNQTIVVRDYQDNPITTYTGSEVLSGTVRPGRSYATEITLVPTWAVPALGTVTVALTAVQTAALSVGQHLIQVGLADLSANFYEGFLVVEFGAGADTLPPTYCEFSDLLTYTSWIMNLQTRYQTAGFITERGLARQWLDQVIINHAGSMLMNPQIGQPGFMPLSLFPATTNPPQNLWLRQQLNLDFLVRRQQVIECTAKKAISFILQFQLDMVNDNERKLAYKFERDANAVACSLRAEITLGTAHPLNQDIWPSLTVDCSRSSLRG